MNKWPHYDTYCLRKKHQDILEDCDSSYFGSHQLADVLYFLYNPDYYFSTYRWTEDLYGEYEEKRQQIVSVMQEKGYEEKELSDIYDSNADGDGYLHSSDLDKYLKEGN